jgi:superfamily II DNA or RNA helicase
MSVREPVCTVPVLYRTDVDLDDLETKADIVDIEPVFIAQAVGSIRDIRVALFAKYGEAVVQLLPGHPGPDFLLCEPSATAQGTAPPAPPPAAPDDDESRIPPEPPVPPKVLAIRTHPTHQADAVADLVRLGLEPSGDYLVAQGDSARAAWAALPQLPSSWHVLVPEWIAQPPLRQTPLSAHAIVTSGGVWLHLQLTFGSEGIACSRRDLLEAIRDGRRFVLLSDGSFAAFDAPAIRHVLEAEVELLGNAGAGGRLPVSQSVYIQEILQLIPPEAVQLTSGTEALFHKLSDLDHVPAVKQPREFRGKLKPFQLKGLSWLWFLHTMQVGGVLADDMGVGKSLCANAYTMTPSGWRKMGDLQVGDQVIGSNGLPTTVIGVYPQGVKPVVRLTTTTGASVVCCREHLWAVHTPNDRVRGGALRVMSVEAILAKGLKDKAKNRQWFIPIAKAMECPETTFSIHPYLLGALLANGHGKVVNHTWPQEQRVQMAMCLPQGMEYHQIDKWTSNICKGRNDKQNILARIVKEIGLDGHLSHEKFIPQEYLFGSVQQRIDLLQGLMDNDGTISKEGNVMEYNTTSPQLAKDVIHLVRSLGGTAWMSTRDPKFKYKGETKIGKEDHRIRMNVPFCPFRVSWKVERYKPRTKYHAAHAIDTIEPAGEEECVCIAVDAPDHLYVTEDFLLTHNTVQGIALMQKVQETDGKVKVLIVAPTSVAPEWVKAIRKFAPNLSTLLWQGKDRKVSQDQAKKVDVLVTTYALLRYDQDFFCATDAEYDYVILDEAQNIKNPASATAIAAKKIKAKHRLAMSGTPVMNSLADYWSLFDFASPGLFGSLGKFTETFITPVRDGSKDAMEKMRRLAKPFVLRRMKKDVATELPEKQELVRMCEMTPKQAAVYRKVREEMENLLAQDDGGKNSLTILQGITKMRQISLDARLVSKGDTTLTDADSGKLEELLEILDQCLAGDHKVLVFSQFTSMLDLISGAIKKKGIIHELLTGATPSAVREEQVARFQRDPTCAVFLLSLQAAGVGLNLFAADTVILCDPWWNQAVEDQATDRAHRTGQKNPVTVYRLISTDTIEEKIMVLKEKKKTLAENAVPDDGIGDKLLTQDEIKFLLSKT